MFGSWAGSPMKRWDRLRLLGFVTDTGGTFVFVAFVSFHFCCSYLIKEIVLRALVYPITDDNSPYNHIHHAVDLPNPSLYLANVLSLLTL